MVDNEKSADGLDPRRIRRKSANQLSADMIKGFSDLEKAEYDKKGKGVYYNEKKDPKKENDKLIKQLEYAAFDHDRKSRTLSRPIPILKDKLVPNDLHTPEVDTNKKEKVTFAKNVRHKKRSKFKTLQKEKK